MTEEQKKWLKDFWTPAKTPFRQFKEGEIEAELKKLKDKGEDAVTCSLINSKEFYEESENILNERR